MPKAVIALPVTALLVLQSLARGEDSGLSLDVDPGPRPRLHLFDREGNLVGGGRRTAPGTTYIFGPDGRVEGFVTPRGVVRDRAGRYRGRLGPLAPRTGSVHAEPPFLRRR